MSQHEPILNLHKSIIALIFIFIAVHLCQILLFEGNDSFLRWLSFIPACFAGNASLSKCPDIIYLSSWVTHMFLHGDWGHLFMNALIMLIFGSAVAQRLGNARFLLFSALCGVAGALTHLLIYWGDHAYVFGASAAISGQVAGAVRYLFGARSVPLSPDHHSPAHPHTPEMRLQRSARFYKLSSLSNFFRDFRAILFVWIWVLSNVLMGVYVDVGSEPRVLIAWEAHLGGFFAGLFLIDLFDPVRPANSSSQTV